ncbi:LytR/AlgR family response regulator transcription factor [Flavobacterium sp. RHBU_3]|uniref:LytR/AlgR family response regulator transcription factor n=1 Tax=Flavobacterium sp. RHBU_3 TaxID=3391184 RepID=UPI0039856440
MQYTYAILDDDSSNIQETLRLFEDFPDYHCVGIASDREKAIDIIIEASPELVFLTVKKNGRNINISLGLIYELHRYLNELPYFIILSDTKDFAFDAINAGVFDYLLLPLQSVSVRKALLKFQKIIPLSGTVVPKVLESPFEVSERVDFEKNGIENGRSEVDIQICIKSYGDYQFIALKDVVYLKADNNTTDFHLHSGKVLTAYKTLKHYENNLPSFFYRIHNSYIVNSYYVSRINTGKSLCYLNNNEVSVSFSKTFKDNIDAIIKKIAPEYI